MSRFLNSLFGRVVVALILGVALGAFFPQFAESLRPLGDAFLYGFMLSKYHQTEEES